MTTPVALIVLLGLFGVPVALLLAGRRVRFFDRRRRGAYRGAIVGYAGACAVTLVLVLLPPFVWPPASTVVRAWLAGGLLLAPVLGAVIGGAVAASRR